MALWFSVSVCCLHDECDTADNDVGVLLGIERNIKYILNSFSLDSFSSAEATDSQGEKSSLSVIYKWKTVYDRGSKRGGGKEMAKVGWHWE